MIDGGPCFPKVRFTVDLTGSFQSAAPAELEELLVRNFEIAPFSPPSRERVREFAVSQNKLGLSRKQIAANFDGKVSELTVGQALKLQEQLDTLGIDDPFYVLESPPNDYPKFRRHLNPRYEFSTEKGYQRFEL